MLFLSYLHHVLYFVASEKVSLEILYPFLRVHDLLPDKKIGVMNVSSSTFEKDAILFFSLVYEEMNQASNLEISSVFILIFASERLFAFFPFLLIAGRVFFEKIVIIIFYLFKWLLNEKEDTTFLLW